MSDQIGLVGDRRVRLRPLRWWWIVAAAVLVVAAAVGVGWWLWIQSEGLARAEVAQARADAIRTGLAAAAGTGAALALLLAVRRQRSTELALDLQADDLAQKERIAAASAHDATQRRITELYAQAVDQLGSEKAAVRLGGLHALERLAQDDEGHRQTVVDVLCAYLRMPYTPNRRPDPRPGAHEPDAADGIAPAAEVGQPTVEQREQEHQVRQTAQRILASHLRPDRDEQGQPNNPKFWPGMDVDLAGAYLIDFALNECEVGILACNNTTFAGETLLRALVCEMAFIQGAAFIHGQAADTFAADFRGARFRSDAWFSFTSFAGEPWFHADEFYRGTHFGGHASFHGATFHRGARFDGASFDSTVDLTDASTRSDLGQWPAGWVEHQETDPIDGISDETHSRWSRLIPAAAAT